MWEYCDLPECPWHEKRPQDDHRGGDDDDGGDDDGDDDDDVSDGDVVDDDDHDLRDEGGWSLNLGWVVCFCEYVSWL